MEKDFELERLMRGPEVPNIFGAFGDPMVGNPTQYMIEQAFHAAGGLVAARCRARPAHYGRADRRAGHIARGSRGKPDPRERVLGIDRERPNIGSGQAGVDGIPVLGRHRRREQQDRS